jgi:hypothetical protein
MITNGARITAPFCNLLCYIEIVTVSLPQVRYMISEIQYGGRITDDFDRTLMNTYAEQYFHQGVMDKACQLYPGYKVPDGLEISNFRTVSGAPRLRG